MAIAKYTIEDSSKNWNINEFQNKLAYIKSGIDIRHNKIISNTSNTLVLQNQVFVNSINCQYEIINPTIFDINKVNKHVFLTGGDNQSFLMPDITLLEDGDVISIKNNSGYNIVLYFDNDFDLVISPSFAKHNSLFLHSLEWTYIIVEKSQSNPNGIYRILMKQSISNSDYIKRALNIGDNNDRIVLDNYYSIYKTTVNNSDINFTILSTNLTPFESIITFELHLNLTTANNITFNTGVTWINGSAPTINEIKNYVIIFRSHDGGTTWIANLAYTY